MSSITLRVPSFSLLAKLEAVANLCKEHGLVLTGIASSSGPEVKNGTQLSFVPVKENALTNISALEEKLIQQFN